MEIPFFKDQKEEEAFTRGVLAVTSGSNCRRVRELVSAAVDMPMDSEERFLTGIHIENCPECRKIADILRELPQELPRLAEMAPDSGFTQEVLQRTGLAKPAAQLLTDPLVEWWKRLLRRPRFTLEAAYLGTLFLLGLMVNPWIPLRDQVTTVFAATQEKCQAVPAIVGSSAPKVLESLGAKQAFRKASTVLTSFHPQDDAKKKLQWWREQTANILRSVQTFFLSGHPTTPPTSQGEIP